MPDEFQTLKKERSIEIIMNLHAWVVPKTSLRRVLYFPTLCTPDIQAYR